MSQFLYVTGNRIKFNQAVAMCRPNGIQLVQSKLDIPEIQAETGEPVARDKAAKAYAFVGQPLLVSDDSWIIPGLKGFPGPYMKHVNDWFTLDDWLRLTRDLSDRTIILRQIVVYQDEEGQTLFSVDVPGVLLTEARGSSEYPHAAITSFDGGKHSNAEYHEKGQSAAEHHHNVWNEFVVHIGAKNS